MDKQLLEIVNADISLLIYFSFILFRPPSSSLCILPSPPYFSFLLCLFSSLPPPSFLLLPFFTFFSLSSLISSLLVSTFLFFLSFFQFLLSSSSILLSPFFLLFFLSRSTFPFFLFLSPFSYHCPSDLLNLRNLQIREMCMDATFFSPVTPSWNYTLSCTLYNLQVHDIGLIIFLQKDINNGHGCHMYRICSAFSKHCPNQRKDIFIEHRAAAMRPAWLAGRK
jgi:hypothetical protein